MAKIKENDPIFKELEQYLEEYGLDRKFSDHVDTKLRSNGNYIVILFREGPPHRNQYIVVDIASDGRGNWQMQNDCSDEITMEQWKKLFIVPECDWYDFK